MVKFRCQIQDSLDGGVKLQNPSAGSYALLKWIHPSAEFRLGGLWISMSVIGFILGILLVVIEEAQRRGGPWRKYFRMERERTLGAEMW
jgi:hypothetical protein